DTGVCQYTVVGTEFDATFTDNCTSGSITNDLNGTATIAGEVLPKGVTTVLWTVNDGNGQSATCTTLITVEDNEAPIISCVANDTRDTDAGECQYTVVGTEFDATFTDNCTSGTITNDLNGTATIAGEILATGVTTVVWTVNDGNGQSATCTTLITVEDNEAPLIACSADLSANTDLGMCSAVVIFADAIALDNCGIASIVQTGGDPSGTAFPVGVSTIEYTATDIHGNVSVCSFNITVTDNEAPITVCQDITIQLDATGTATIVASDVDGGSTDNCGIASTTIDMDTFDCSNVGPNNVTLTVTDVNGNVSNCIAIVTVEDITTPVVVCQDITVQLDPTGTVTITGTDIDDGSTDACGIASYDLDIDTFDCSNVGPNTVVLTVTDVNGNSETCTATVTVEDNTLPELVCMDITLELGADGTVTITPSDVIASNTDACGIATTAVDITDFDCSDIGTPVTVQVFSEDANGNLATCFATVTVVDAFAPEITCPADQTVDPGAGNLFYEVPDYFATGEATVTDNCTDPVTITTQDPAPGTLLPDGTYTITLTATDEYGNIGTCSFELTVESVLGVNDIELEIANVSLYPNPAKEYVILSNPQAIALEQADIYDMRGRFIASIDLRTMGTEKQIDISTLASATYTVIIKYDQGQTSRRLLKE
ncbi:HYR domain-containing protein, partial [Ulvibacter litoralis]